MHESGENELARSIRGEGFVNIAITDVQDLLVEQKVGKVGLIEIASGPQVNEIDSSSDEDNEVNNLILKSYMKD